MIDDSTSELDRLLDRAEELLELGQTPTVEQLCREFPDLRSPILKDQVRKHLEAHRSLERFLCESDDLPTQDCCSTWRPNQIGTYEVLDEIARGGMGIVYRCLQTSPRREVAVKVMQPGVVADSALKRFRLESEVLALLQSPGIAQVFEAGEADLGFGVQPYFAMELITGSTLDEYASDNALDTNRRVELIIKVCRAIEHAHRRGVIHRDLKPANIMVDATGQPKVLDFGIARLSRDQRIDTSTLRSSHSVLGSLPYMSPEQMTGRPGDGDVRSDVYSLGVIAYQLLTGRLPHPVEDRSLLEIVRIVGQTPAPSLRSTGRRFPIDLVVVIAKSLEKDADRRYQTVAQFADDLDRFLQSKPISARAANSIQRFWRWSCSHPWQVTAATLTAVSLFAILFAVNLYRATLDAESRRRQIAFRLTVAERASDHIQRQADVMSQELGAAQRRNQSMELLRIQEVLDDGDFRRAEEWLEEFPFYQRQFAWRLLKNYCERQSQLVIHPGAGPRIDVALSNDAECVALLGRELKFYDAVTGEKRATRIGTGQRGFVTFSPDGRSAASVFKQRHVRLWNYRTHEVTEVLSEHEGQILCGRFSHDGKWLATGSDNGELKLWDVADPGNSPPVIRLDAPVVSVGFSNDSQRFSAVQRSGETKCWGVATQDVHYEWKPEYERNRQITLSPDSRLLASQAGGASVLVRSAETGAQLASLSDFRTRIFGFEFSGDGKFLAISGNDRKVAFWDMSTFQRVAVLSIPGRARLVSFSADGSHMVTHDGAGNLSVSRITDLEIDRNWVFADAEITQVECLPTGSSAILGDAHGNLRRFDWSDQIDELLVPGDGHPVNVMRLSPDGAQLAYPLHDGTLRLIDLRSSEVRRLEGHRRTVRCLAYAPDGKTFASASTDNTIRIWETESGTCLRVIENESTSPTAILYHPSGRHLLCTGRDGAIYSHNLDTNTKSVFGDPNEMPIKCLAFSDDGRMLVTSGVDPVIRYWAFATNRLLAESIGHVAEVNAIRLSPDGSSLVSASSDRSIRLWDSVTGDLQAVLRGANSAVEDVAFSSDGNTLIAASGETRLRYWPTTQQSKPSPDFARAVSAADFTDE